MHGEIIGKIYNYLTLNLACSEQFQPRQFDHEAFCTSTVYCIGSF